jgi:hypothetical protein
MYGSQKLKTAEFDNLGGGVSLGAIMKISQSGREDWVRSGESECPSRESQSTSSQETRDKEERQPDCLTA